MSSPRAIPKRQQPRQQSSVGGGYNYGAGMSAASSSSSYSAWDKPMHSSSPSTPTCSSSSSSSSTPSSSMALPSTSRYAERRPSLLSSSLSRSEYTVINVGGPDGPPRLITCVKSSQGFDWNQDIFLPSYMDYESDLEHRPDPVREIVLTDEEAAAIFPQ
ncbi:hypothetical protein AAFC00_001085 [Neodothiora populina]|uniref:Uncharacterized protein n=1 Tax=Neodothiora populina TaxID=2781224 RepID=A0ABR3PN23_9PEZI